jgi:SUMO ligase MMS21 Smc5/6 complex component
VNVIDSPSKEFFKLNNSDIIAVFDFDLINELKQVYEYKSEPYNIVMPQLSLNIFGKEVSEKREEVLNQRFSTELKQQKAFQK